MAEQFVSEKDLPVRMTLVGDVCLGEHYFNCGSGLFSQALAGNEIDPFGSVGSFIEGSDLFLFNLESPVSMLGLQKNDIYSRCFRGHPMTLKFLCPAACNVASVANNHIMQHGADVAFDTLRNLGLSNVDHVGVKQGVDGSLCEPYIKIIKGKRFVLLSWSQVAEQHVNEDDVIYAYGPGDSALRQISEFAEASDFLIVTIHAGQECVMEQNQLSELLRSVADAGADLVVTHHSHFFHRVEYWHGSLIFYGLGNFVFDLLWNDLLISSYLVQVEVDERIRKLMLIPVLLDSMGLPTINGPVVRFDLENCKHGEVVFPDPQGTSLRIPLTVVKLSYFLGNLSKGEKKLKLSFLKHKLQDKVLRGRFS